jgi:aconitate hydratase
MFESEYANVFDGNAEWNAIPVSGGELYEFDPESTYIQEPSFFQNIDLEVPEVQPIRAARCIALLGDSVTTDHISPAGSIPENGPAGQYLIRHGVAKRDFNSFGSRRGNHEVMIRGTFGNIRLKNQLVPGTEGGVTIHYPSGEKLSIFDACERYIAEGTPLVVIAGKEYGTGSSRDWAAKGTFLLGIKAVIAQSYERIHRSNLVGMGVLPLEFLDGQSAASLGLSGAEVFAIDGLDKLEPMQKMTVRSKGDKGEICFDVRSRIDSAVEIDYYLNGGILHSVLRSMIREQRG